MWTELLGAGGCLNWQILHAGPKVPATVSTRHLCVDVPSLGLMTRHQGRAWLAGQLRMIRAQSCAPRRSSLPLPRKQWCANRWVRESQGCARQNWAATRQQAAAFGLVAVLTQRMAGSPDCLSLGLQRRRSIHTGVEGNVRLPCQWGSLPPLPCAKFHATWTAVTPGPHLAGATACWRPVLESWHAIRCRLEAVIQGKRNRRHH